MNADANMLLWQSAEHWLWNWQEPEYAEIYNEACPCCDAYLHQQYPCSGCPIAEHTGKQYCRGTPWSDVAGARPHNFPDLWTRAQYKRFKEAIAKEYEFLVTLALTGPRQEQRHGRQPLGAPKALPPETEEAGQEAVSPLRDSTHRNSPTGRCSSARKGAKAR